MARINKISLKPTMWLVQVSVHDPQCIFSINPSISYKRLVAAMSSGAAARAAATYCNKKMLAYPGTQFTYSTECMEPYYYPVQRSFKEEPHEVCTTTKI